MTLSMHATTIAPVDGKTVITYHATAIVVFDCDTVTLNNGGYKTATTKRKMNQAANQFDLRYSVYQRDGKWFVNLPDGETVDFEDGMTFNRR